jgi:hypothetical protein
MLAILKNVDSLEEIEVDIEWNDLKLQNIIKGLSISGLSFSNLEEDLVIYGYKKPILRRKNY